MFVRCIGCCMACWRYQMVVSRIWWAIHRGILSSDGCLTLAFLKECLNQTCASVAPVQCFRTPCSPSRHALRDDDLLLRFLPLWVLFLWEDPGIVLCVSTFLGRLSHVPVARLPALAWTPWLRAHTKDLKFWEPPTTRTEFRLMCSSDWTRRKAGSVI